MLHSGARLIGNEASNGGGLSVGTYAVLSGTEILSNTASLGGGGILNYGALSLVNATVSSNETAGDGGGLRNDAGTITLPDGQVLNQRDVVSIDGSTGEVYPRSARPSTTASRVRGWPPFFRSPSAWRQALTQS